MTPTLSPSPFAVRPRSAGWHPWADVWFQSDLVGVSVTLACCGVLAVSFGLYLIVDMWAGLFIGQLLFPLALLGSLGFLLRCGRQRETTAGIRMSSCRCLLTLPNGQPAAVVHLRRRFAGLYLLTPEAADHVAMRGELHSTRNGPCPPVGHISLPGGVRSVWTCQFTCQVVWFGEIGCL